MYRTTTLLFLTAAFSLAQDHPTGPRITPPTLTTVTPRGVARGATTEITVEGLNLAKASAIYFSEAGIKGRILRVKELPDLPDIRLGSNGTPSTIDVGPLPPRNQVTIELDIAPEANVGAVKFRLLTPLGTSPEGSFVVEPYYGESVDKEPNDSAEEAVEAFLPAVLTGAISRPGDVDHFKIHARAGEEIVFLNQAAMAGSALQPVIRVLDSGMKVLAEYGYTGDRAIEAFSHKFPSEGTYYVRINDYENSGRATNSYRILAGKFPVATSAYPLGVRKNAAGNIHIAGLGLPASFSAKPTSSGRLETFEELRPTTPIGPAFNELKLALGDDPEVESNAANLSAKTAQAVTLPITINGRIAAPKTNLPTENYFKFAARKGQQVILEVNARRLGSSLDSLIEVLDAAGKPVEQAVARATWETFLVLRDHDSQTRGLRIQSWNSLSTGDYVMVGNEIVRVDEVPDGPDEDMTIESFGAQRKSFFNTSSEAHGIDRAVYKVQMHPAGSQFSPNGLPLVRLYFRNDDGGPGYGKDSFVTFTAPADGEYMARIRDIRGLGGDDYAYRLNIREPRPDFELSVSPRNPNVPRGGSIPVTVTALKREGFNAPIEVSFASLPAGLKATKNTIAPGLDTTTLLLSADENADLKDAVAFDVTGSSTANGRAITHRANPGDDMKLIALMPRADVRLLTKTTVVELAPGETAEVTVAAERANGFTGRVPVIVTDLPSRVRVTDSGLNGVLIHEDGDSTTFRLWALPNAEPAEGYIYLSARIETRSPQQNMYASVEPVLVRVKAAPQISAKTPTAVERSSAPK
ncbi:MAG TPA: hypothetical protein VFB63_29150 [Bryobacteraceae bacterium]|nr:hypothetical protein [Bryobacteraceae bacterium]